MSDQNGRDANGGGQEPMGAEELTPEDPARQKEDSALKARLKKLTASLDARKKADREKDAKAANKTGLGGDAAKAIGLGFRILSDLIGGVLVGAAIGYGLDWLFSTSPFLLIVFLLLGTAGGFWNVIRTVNKM